MPQAYALPQAKLKQYKKHLHPRMYKTSDPSLVWYMHYYGKFLPKLSTLLQPLNRLLKEEHKWAWSPECTKAFQDLLSSAPVLAHYNPSLPIKMAGDASAYGIGAVISHVFANGEERPVAYALSASEQNYSQIEKEALSLVFRIQKFHTYLYGRKFTSLSPLSWDQSMVFPLWQQHASRGGPYCCQHTPTR